MDMQSNKEWACRAASMSLVLAEQCGQRPERVVVNSDDKSNPYGLQRRRLDTWGSPRMKRCYFVGFQIIPLLAEATDSFAAFSTEDVVRKSWSDLRQAGLVQNELEAEEFSEVVSLTDEVVELLDNNSQAIKEIANTLATKQELQFTEIDEVLDRYGLVFNT